MPRPNSTSRWPPAWRCRCCNCSATRRASATRPHCRPWRSPIACCPACSSLRPPAFCTATSSPRHDQTPAAPDRHHRARRLRQRPHARGLRRRKAGAGPEDLFQRPTDRTWPVHRPRRQGAATLRREAGGPLAGRCRHAGRGLQLQRWQDRPARLDHHGAGQWPLPWHRPRRGRRGPGRGARQRAALELHAAPAGGRHDL
mmetsp:Transcript_5538/g.13420  ORF Transcript_5538/g.13420 Transcript_5538/m.13420 type:complete len:200 (+) Transcript_5538:1260-1859(+)